MMGQHGKLRVRISHSVFVHIARKTGKEKATQTQRIQILFFVCVSVLDCAVFVWRCVSISVYTHCSCCVCTAKQNQPQNSLHVKWKVFSTRNLITDFY